MTTTRDARLDLSLLRTLLVLAALVLGLVAASPGGAAAQPNTGGGTSTGQKNCEDGGGTWTVEGDRAYCKGRKDGTSWSCNLKVNPNGTACSHLPGSGRAERAGGRASGGGYGIVVVAEPAQVAAEAAAPAAQANAEAEAGGDGSAMTPLDE